MGRLIIQERGKHKYLYFLYKGRRSYLGTPKDIKVERAIEALNYLNKEIEKCINEQQKIENFLSPKEEYKISDKPYYKLVVFDAESLILPTVVRTDISQPIKIWRELFRKLGQSEIYDKIKEIYKGYIEFTEAASEILRTLRMKKETFEDVINEFIVIPNTKTVFKELRRHKIITVLISDTFEALTRRISKELNGIDIILSYCRFNFRDNILNSWNLNPVGRKQRKDFIEKVAEKYEIPLKQCAYVGNSINDIDAFESVGLAISLNSPDILQFADVEYITGGLTGILDALYLPLRKRSMRKK